MGKLVDKTGKKYGRLTVIKRGPNKGRNVRWYCKCDCGNPDLILIYSSNLREDGHTTSCGCVKKEKIRNVNFKDLTGKTFGRLTVLEETDRRSGTSVVWKCKCNCEENKITYVSANNLLSGAIISCGCYNSEIISKNLLNKKFGKLLVIEKTDKRTKDRNIIWKCKCDCGNKDFVYVDTHNLLRGHTSSCGCLKSKGEEKIIKILSNLDIDFVQQKTFNNCVNPNTGYKLKFDFYLSDYNCCIEYDGEQHFKEAWNGKEGLKENQYKDNIKNKYCKNNNIRLIRIPYWDYDKIDTKYIKELLNE